MLRPDRATPGVPPSSLIAFLRQVSNRGVRLWRKGLPAGSTATVTPPPLLLQHGSIGGVVLTDFDAQFLNPNYNSHTDTLGKGRVQGGRRPL